MEEETKVHENTLFPEQYDLISDIIKDASRKHSHARAMLTFLPWEPGPVINVQQIRQDFLKGKEKGLFKISKENHR